MTQLVANAKPMLEVAPTEAAAPVLLRAEGLKVAFGGQVVLDGADLELRRGEVILLRGENGSGKTTLLNVLTGNLEPDAGVIHYVADGRPRTYRFPRRWWQELNPFDHFTPEFVAREGVGRTWQDIRLFGSESLRDNITVAERGHPGENPVLALLSPNTSARREVALGRAADAILARLGLGGREESSADKISLGQSKRVAIARAVAAGARVLFLDEPLAGLDRQGINDVVELLESLVSDHQVTLVIVEHLFNQPHLLGLVTTNWVLANGTITKVPGGRRVDGSSRALRVVPSPTSNQRPPWVALLTPKDAEVMDEPLPRGALLTRIRQTAAPKKPLKPLLQVRGLVVRRGSRVVIGLDEKEMATGFDLTIYEGEITILHAPNGWGKSTLFDAISGLIQPDSGSILLDGKRIDQLPAWGRIRQGLRAVPSGHHTFPNLLAEETLRLAGNAQGAIELGQLASRICSSLSGGERQRLALAAITPGKVGLYDEPFSALDENNTTMICAPGSAGLASAQLILVPGQA